MKKALYVLIQCTWGLLQTLIGLGFSLANRDCAHQVYRCCIDTNTKWNARGGLSLGLFIFTPLRPRTMWKTRSPSVCMNMATPSNRWCWDR